MDNRGSNRNAPRAQSSRSVQSRQNAEKNIKSSVIGTNGSHGGAVLYAAAPRSAAVRHNDKDARRAQNRSVTVREIVAGTMLFGRSLGGVTTVKAAKRKPFPVTALFMTLICTALFMFMIVSYVQINEYTLEVSGLRTELSSLTSEEKELTLDLEKKNDMLAIEQFATENLGMVKVDQITKKHITIDREDKIEVVEPEPTDDSTVVTTVMSSLLSNFNGLWEYIN